MLKNWAGNILPNANNRDKKDLLTSTEPCNASDRAKSSPNVEPGVAMLLWMSVAKLIFEVTG